MPVVVTVAALICTAPGASVVNWAIFTFSLNKVVPAVLTAKVLAPSIVFIKLMLPNAPAPVELRIVLLNKVMASL